MKKFNRFFTILIFVFLYIPMAVLVVGSFNEGKSLVRFDGFTFGQYAELFRDPDMLGLLLNSIIIAVLSSTIATVFGTFAAVGIHGLKPKMRKAVMSLTNIPMTNPDIITGISLMLMFVFVVCFIRKCFIILTHINVQPPFQKYPLRVNLLKNI